MRTSLWYGTNYRHRGVAYQRIDTRGWIPIHFVSIMREIFDLPEDKRIRRFYK